MIQVRSGTVVQSRLSSECWSIQFWGLDACSVCEFKDTPECGGVDILSSGRNSKGFEVPI